MPAEVRAFTVTVPAGTAQAAPVTLPLTVPVRTLRSVEVTVPAGCVGLVGFQIAITGVQIIPVNGGQWIIANDRVLKWETSGYPDSGAYQLIGYNTDLFDHNLYVVLELDLPQGTDTTGGSPLIANSDLNPGVVSAS